MLVEIYDTLKRFFWLIVVAWISKAYTSSCNLYVCELLIYLLTRGDQYTPIPLRMRIAYNREHTEVLG